ncbi:DUF262 domain-containing protein [Brachybacterium sp. Marseille-Q2903]|uniref:DUF262 domain-containing protein n=1 Tax=Brachybacterium epidermidis TaxID=2781983 RepID=A0ABR9W1E7_9MICO|nr:DUF262 domain-containing protein [Brachybacterium epidermidis]MBE9404276.1 DUF262 domain-containing protein [Brachybacterium epidermidis]
MAINRSLLMFQTVEDLLGPGRTPLRIPDFQRPYSWTPQHARQLVTDIASARERRPEQPYVMGTMILLQRPGEDHFEVVDGQQRLLTLHMLRTLLRDGRLRDLASGTTPIHRVYQGLARLVEKMQDKAGSLRFLDSRAQVLRIVTDDEDEAFQFFDSQNFRGKALRPHDLLKASHLREMVATPAAEQRAVVEQWESAEENDLDRLFGTYLARIHWWSRNLPAHAFTAEDLDLFKGVSRSTPRLPATEYHRAAKTVLPGVQQWAHPDADERAARDLRRARHQLDAPLSAGRSFFDFATFMLEEMERFENLLFRRDTEMGDPDPDLEIFRVGARFRFNRELYIAAALYFTNKYSEDDLHEIRPRLFRWAFGPRLAYERLGWKSTDNFARGLATAREGLAAFNLFARMRDSLDPAQLALENLPIPPTVRSTSEDDKTLQALLEEIR